jgi:hypothetical protein
MRFLVQIGTHYQNISSMSDSGGEQTLGVGIGAHNIQTVVPFQGIAEQLGMDPSVVGD